MKQQFGAAGSDGRKLDASAQAEIARQLTDHLVELTVYARSICAVAGGLVAAARDGERRKLVICGDVEGFDGPRTDLDGGESVLVCDANERLMAALREKVSWLRPVLTGTTPSVGLGDRLGLATPGHIAADPDSGFLLVLAQQSIREMVRTNRTAQQVMDEATFGVFEVGYDKTFGSDADHLKTEADVDVTAAAGFTFFTIDPSDHVDQAADGYDEKTRNEKFQALVEEGLWAEDRRERYLGRTFAIGGHEFQFSESAYRRAVLKYGRATRHVIDMAKYIASKVSTFELEVSVDETEHPTSPEEHIFIIEELTGEGVRIISLAPRFVGEFEKGIDYKGDIEQFERELEKHAAIAKHYGPYKISVHSGSDKFAVYPVVARVTGGLFHLKTAGTSYLEALRVVARHDVSLFREIIGFCRERFDTDKATYHISSRLDKVPADGDLADGDLERVYLDEDDGRQILHVTFGSVLTATRDSKPRFRRRLLALLNREAPTYVDVLRSHIGRHIRGLIGAP